MYVSSGVTQFAYRWVSDSTALARPKQSTSNCFSFSPYVQLHSGCSPRCFPSTRVAAAAPTILLSSRPMLVRAAATWTTVMSRPSSDLWRSCVHSLRALLGVTTPHILSCAFQIGTSQGAIAVTLTRGPSAGILAARASRQVGRCLHLPRRAAWGTGRGRSPGRGAYHNGPRRRSSCELLGSL